MQNNIIELANLKLTPLNKMFVLVVPSCLK